MDSPAILRVPPPLDLPATLEGGQAHRWRRDGEWHWCVVRGNLLKLRQTPAGLEVHSTPPPTESLLDMLRDYFRLEDDLAEVYRGINLDPRMEGLTQGYAGLRVLRQEPWECLAAYICSANSNIVRIGANMDSMAEAFGEPLTLHGRTLYTFPPAHRVAAAGEQALRDLGLGFRAKYLAKAAVEVAEGTLDLEELRIASYSDAKARLIQAPGIGDKIADCVLLFSLDKGEAFPIDRWIRRAVEVWYLKGEKASYSEVSSWAQGYFGQYAGYANQYLFHGGRLEKLGRDNGKPGG